MIAETRRGRRGGPTTDRAPPTPSCPATPEGQVHVFVFPRTSCTSRTCTSCRTLPSAPAPVASAPPSLRVLSRAPSATAGPSTEGMRRARTNPRPRPFHPPLVCHTPPRTFVYTFDVTTWAP